MRVWPTRRSRPRTGGDAARRGGATRRSATGRRPLFVRLPIAAHLVDRTAGRNDDARPARSPTAQVPSSPKASSRRCRSPIARLRISHRPRPSTSSPSGAASPTGWIRARRPPLHAVITNFRLETLIEAPIDVVFDLARDIGLHERSMASTGERAIAGRTSGPIERARPSPGAPVTSACRGRSPAVSPRSTPTTFADQQEAARSPVPPPTHVPTVPGGTRHDDWEHAAPFGPLGRVVDRLVLGRYMRSLLETRNLALKAEAERAAPQAGWQPRRRHRRPRTAASTSRWPPCTRRSSRRHRVW